MCVHVLAHVLSRARPPAVEPSRRKTSCSCACGRGTLGATLGEPLRAGRYRLAGRRFPSSMGDL